MYHDFYQLKENPFNVTADPDFFFSSGTHAAAISNLMYGIEQRKGIMVILGEIGTGKTTLCRKLIRQLDKNTKCALILNPNCSELQLLQMIVHDLGIPTNSKNKFGLLQALNEFLINETIHGNNVVILLDEAQNFSTNQLEQIRLLSNLETEKEKLLQIVLVGQPELNNKLQLPALRQVRQRIAVYFYLQPLEHADVKKFFSVNKRLIAFIVIHKDHRALSTCYATAPFWQDLLQKPVQLTKRLLKIVRRRFFTVSIILAPL